MHLVFFALQIQMTVLAGHPWPWLPSASPWGWSWVWCEIYQQTKDHFLNFKMSLRNTVPDFYIMISIYMYDLWQWLKLEFCLWSIFSTRQHLLIFKMQESSSYLDAGRFQPTLFFHIFPLLIFASLCTKSIDVDCMDILLRVLLWNLLPKSWCIHKWCQTGRTYRGSSLLFPGIQFPFFWQQSNISWNFTHRRRHFRCSFLSACCRMRLSSNSD